ncbi:hypothetical protein TNCV_4522651 [Trichonephila clavipes]|nr:hypothetical protein TNCV_4522651 [Trichonephila clavipes]
MVLDAGANMSIIREDLARNSKVKNYLKHPKKTSKMKLRKKQQPTIYGPLEFPSHGDPKLMDSSYKFKRKGTVDRAGHMGNAADTMHGDPSRIKN